MIVKGGSRSGARQLAVYLMRVERYDTGEPAELIELQSPWAARLDGTDRYRDAELVIEAFRDWQTLVEGTKQGRDGLYRTEISPAPEYAEKMTAEQWKRAADILGEELGLQGQDRACFRHGGTDGRVHFHVVWCRTDIDTMKVISDAENYQAHERASQRMELEFGHEFVPGKHAKRDREKQPEFPREAMSRDEAQQAERTGLSKDERIEQITALKASADNAQAFKAALEDAGYILAKGDRGYIVVDSDGGQSALSRNIGLKKAETEAFMAGVELGQLPTIAEAKALQKERALKQEEPAPEVAPFQPAEQSPFSPPTAEEREIAAIKMALAVRQEKEAAIWAERDVKEVEQLEYELEARNSEKLADRDADDRQAMDELKAAHKEQRRGLKGFIDAVKDKINPAMAAEKAKERRREIAQLKARHERERGDYAALLDQTKQLEIENLKARQELQRGDRQQRHEEEQERYVREQQEAKRLLAEIEEQRKRLEHNDSLRDGPPPPKLGK